MNNFLFCKDEGVSALVVTAVLIVIAVVLCLIFKDKIADLLDSVFTKVTGKVNSELAN